MPDHTATSPLARESRVFSQYLAGIEATPYVTDAYVRAHRHLPANRVPPDALDQLLLGFARRSPHLTRLADAYARRARPVGILRQKLTLQLAVLESSPPAHRWINGGTVGPMPPMIALAAWTVGMGILTLIASAIVFGPFHLATVIRQAGRAR